MALQEVTGASLSELEEMREAHKGFPLYQEHGIAFETCRCLREITNQPDDYDGPTRYCKRRAAKVDEEYREGGKYDKSSYGSFCKNHGGAMSSNGHKNKDNLNPMTAPIRHGAYADDENLKMDFDDHEQELYDDILNDWPEIYNWPPKSEDPARYRILRRVAVNEVRALREEDYIDGQEVITEPVTNDQGQVVDERKVENPLAREYRLLMSEVTNQMKELGLTPKERQKMDTLSAQETKEDALSAVAQEALDGTDEYDPDQFDE